MYYTAAMEIIFFHYLDYYIYDFIILYPSINIYRISGRNRLDNTIPYKMTILFRITYKVHNIILYIYNGECNKNNGTTQK